MRRDAEIVTAEVFHHLADNVRGANIPRRVVNRHSPLCTSENRVGIGRDAAIKQPSLHHEITDDIRGPRHPIIRVVVDLHRHRIVGRIESRRELKRHVGDAPYPITRPSDDLRMLCGNREIHNVVELDVMKIFNLSNRVCRHQRCDIVKRVTHKVVNSDQVFLENERVVLRRVSSKWDDTNGVDESRIKRHRFVSAMLDARPLENSAVTAHDEVFQKSAARRVFFRVRASVHERRHFATVEDRFDRLKLSAHISSQ